MNELKMYLIEVDNHYEVYWAENMTHAVEQVNNAYPDDVVTAVFQCLELDGGYFVNCLMKLYGRNLPAEMYITLSNDLYKQIVFEIEISKINEVH